jgi:hypothetical protein
VNEHVKPGTDPKKQSGKTLVNSKKSGVCAFNHIMDG